MRAIPSIVVVLSLSCSGAQPIEVPRCGDGQLDPGEACDDGNNLDNDGCDAFCRTEQSELGVVFLNEIVASAIDAGPDAIELFNPGQTPTNLEGFQLQDAGGSTFTFPVGALIQPGEHLVLEKDAVNSFAFGVGSDDAITLFDPKGDIIDTADWAEGEIPEGTSFGRFPDGSGAFKRLNTVTLGAANVDNTQGACGDDVIDAGEVCDGANLGGQTCAELGLETGTPACAADCSALLIGSCQGEAPQLALNEIVAKAANNGPDSIEIVNFGATGVDLSGFSLIDSNAQNPVFVFPQGTTLAPGAFLLLAQGANSFDFGLGAADSLSLKDAQNNELDFISWADGDAPEGASFGRFPDGTGNFKTLNTVTPGLANVDNTQASCGDGVIDAGEVCDGNDLSGESCEGFGLSSGALSCLSDCSDVSLAQCLGPAQGSVFLNEAVAKAINNGPDAIELFNADLFSVDLSGLQLTDQGGGQFIFGAGTIITPGEFLVLERDAAGSFTFGLGDDDAVSLRDIGGLELDVIDWALGEAPEGKSFGRFPDGQGAAKTLNTVTLGQTNIE